MPDSGAEPSLPSEIRGVLIPLQHSRLLLPNAAAAEVIDFTAPAQDADAPDWLLGTLDWRQRRLPVVQLEILLGQATGQAGVRQRVVVCHSLHAQARRPFFGIVAASTPRLMRVRGTEVQGLPMDPSAQQAPVHAKVLCDGVEALIPDLSGIERLLAEHL